MKPYEICTKYEISKTICRNGEVNQSKIRLKSENLRLSLLPCIYFRAAKFLHNYGKYICIYAFRTVLCIGYLNPIHHNKLYYVH